VAHVGCLVHLPADARPARAVQPHQVVQAVVVLVRPRPADARWRRLSVRLRCVVVALLLFLRCLRLLITGDFLLLPRHPHVQRHDVEALQHLVVGPPHEVRDASPALAVQRVQAQQLCVILRVPRLSPSAAHARGERGAEFCVLVAFVAAVDGGGGGGGAGGAVEVVPRQVRAAEEAVVALLLGSAELPLIEKE
jgi:hypothetical protein